MKKIFLFICSVFTVSLVYAQKRALKFDIMAGLHKPTRSLDIENILGWRLGGGFRYTFKNKSSLNILQLNYDKFIESSVMDNTYQKENARFSNTLSLLTGYSYPILKRTYIGGNMGVGFVGHNRIDRKTKFGINPFISIEPFHRAYLDFGYLIFYGGYRNTSYVNINLRYSF